VALRIKRFAINTPSSHLFINMLQCVLSQASTNQNLSCRHNQFNHIMT